MRNDEYTAKMKLKELIEPLYDKAGIKWESKQDRLVEEIITSIIKSTGGIPKKERMGKFILSKGMSDYFY